MSIFDKKVEHEILEVLRESLKVQKQILHRLPPLVPLAATLKFTWGTPSPTLAPRKDRLSQFQARRLFKETDMPVQLNPGQTVTFTVSPLDAQGNPSKATLSNLSFTSSDPTVFSVSPDPNNANGGVVTAGTNLPTTPDAAALTATATATEPDGVTTESISGTDTVTVVTTPPPPPPPPVAASLAIIFGTPAKKR